MPELNIRRATIADCSQILAFITELAVYENAEKEVMAGVTEIQESLFGENAVAKAVICEAEESPVGFAVYFYSYSTWLGQNCLYLEDLYVTPRHRGIGAGKALLRYLARLAVNNGCQRFEWSVLDWNKPAIDFYHSMGAEPQSEWIKYRLSGHALLSAAEA